MYLLERCSRRIYLSSSSQPPRLREKRVSPSGVSRWVSKQHSLPWFLLNPACHLANLPADYAKGLLHADSRDIDQSLAILASGTPPQVFWAGFDAPRLIDQSFWKSWTVTTRPARTGDSGRVEGLEEHVVQSLPRQWVDMYGQRMKKDWESCCTMALGTIISRAGISEASLQSTEGFLCDESGKGQC